MPQESARPGGADASPELPDRSRAPTPAPLPSADELCFENFNDRVPVTAGLILSVVQGQRLEEVVNHYERHRDPETQAAATHVLLCGLNHAELIMLARKLGEPVNGTFGQLLRRLLARC